MRVLCDNVEEGGDGPFDALLITATAMSLMALLVVLALTYGRSGNMGDGNSRSDNRRNRSSEEPVDANDIVPEFQDELVSAEEGLVGISDSSTTYATRHSQTCELLRSYKS